MKILLTLVGLLALVLVLLAVLRTGFALLRQHWLGLALIAQLAAVVDNAGTRNQVTAYDRPKQPE